MKIKKLKLAKYIQNFQPKKLRTTIKHKNMILNLLIKKKTLLFPENLALEKQLHLNG
jgi:hypothetical protein